MPRAFYRAVVALEILVAGLVVLGAEVCALIWLAGRYPSPLAWTGFVLLGLVDVGLFRMLWGQAVECVKRA